MVGSVDRRGYQDWVAQRVTAILIGIYAIYLLSYLIAKHPSYVQWDALFHNLLMKVASFIVLLSVLWHAWIGLWTVLTDYVKSRPVRLLLEILIALVLVSYIIWFLDVMLV